MTSKSKKGVGRRTFLAGAAAAGAAMTAASNVNAASATARAERVPAATLPSAKRVAMETRLPAAAARTESAPGSDFMVDVIKSLDISYVHGW